MYFVTGNANKFKEVKGILPEIEQLEFDTTEIQSLDIQEISSFKLDQAYEHAGKSICIEDVGFYINALNGFPGPLVKWWNKSLKPHEIWKIVSEFDDHTAYVKDVVGYITETGEKHFFEAVVQGTIVEPRGDKGFGFDPLFIVDGFDKTCAQMTIDEKNAISWRGRAFRKLAEFVS